MPSRLTRFYHILGLFCLFSLSVLYADTAAQVTIRAEGKGSFQLLVNGSPRYIKGAGWNAYMSDIPAAGGNTIRTWGEDGLGAVLDEAQRNGLMVIAGLWVPHERHGFDYSDEKAVKKKLDDFRTVVAKYKNHPALLMWGIGNEYNLQWHNRLVWKFVNDTSKMIHETDGNHPTMTVLAGVSQPEIYLLTTLAPDVDILGINGYGGLNGFISELKRSSWVKPWIVSEWGPVGYWEVSTTSWGAPIEPATGIKSDQFREHQKSFTEEPACIGACIFFWGWKQERTHTWFGLYLPDGRPLETRETISTIWTGKIPVDRAVRVEGITAEGFDNREVKSKTSQPLVFTVTAVDKESGVLQYSWELFLETTATSGGGDHENRTALVSGMFAGDTTKKSVTMNVSRKGQYRLFAYVTDGHGLWGTANIPFLVN